MAQWVRGSPQTGTVAGSRPTARTRKAVEILSHLQKSVSLKILKNKNDGVGSFKLTPPPFL